MFVKAIDQNPGGIPLPRLYECDRIYPRIGEGDRWVLDLERDNDTAVRIEMEDGWLYRVLNNNGGNVDAIRSPRPKDPAADPVLKLYAHPETVGWLGYAEREEGGVVFWVTLEGRCIPNTHTMPHGAPSVSDEPAWLAARKEAAARA